MKKPPSRTQSREKEEKDFYRLHIDEKPHTPPVSLLESSAPKTVAHHTPPHLAHHATHHTKPKFISWLWDKVQFVLVSAVVFVLIYVALNWQALSLNAVHFWQVWRGVKSPLEELVKDVAPPEEKLTVSPATPSRGVAVIPPLDIEISPPDMRLVIPRINQNVPVVGVKNENLIARQWNALEADIQKALRNGVIHYPGTALPGDNGNVVITGHSSYSAWDPGRFKDVFALLHDVKVGDKVVVYFNQKKFIYEVENMKVVLPKDVDVLAPVSSERLTLITCTPIGTNLKRLVLTAKLIEKS